MEFSLATEGRLLDVADALDAENEAAAKKNAPQYLTQDEFWADVFADEPPSPTTLWMTAALANVLWAWFMIEMAE